MQAIVDDQGYSQNILETGIPVWVPKRFAKKILESTNYKSVVLCLKYISLHLIQCNSSLNDQNILKLSHCTLKTTLAQLCKSEHEIMINTFFFFSLSLKLWSKTFAAAYWKNNQEKWLKEVKRSFICLFCLIDFFKQSTLASWPAHLWMSIFRTIYGNTKLKKRK